MVKHRRTWAPPTELCWRPGREPVSDRQLAVWVSRPARSQQAQQAAASSTTASVPLMDVSTVPPHRRRDVDGNYGEAPPRGAAQQVRQALGS